MVVSPLPIPVHGLTVPPRIPFWQSKMKQKSEATSNDSPVKEVQVVPGPESKKPEPASKATVTETFRILFRMAKSPILDHT